MSLYRFSGLLRVSFNGFLLFLEVMVVSPLFSVEDGFGVCDLGIEYWLWVFNPTFPLELFGLDG